jgi:hypothetical protein
MPLHNARSNNRIILILQTLTDCCRKSILNWLHEARSSCRIIKWLLSFYGTWKFMDPILNQMNPVHTVKPYLRPLLILSFHLCLGLPSYVFSVIQGAAEETHVFRMASIWKTCVSSAALCITCIVYDSIKISDYMPIHVDNFQGLINFSLISWYANVSLCLSLLFADLIRIAGNRNGTRMGFNYSQQNPVKNSFVDCVYHFLLLGLVVLCFRPWTQTPDIWISFMRQ